jgi:hypothetical protein
MASTTIDEVAAVLKTKATVSVSQTVTAYKWVPRDLDLPAAVVQLPTVRRRPLEDDESRLGATDWLLDFPVVFYVDLAVSDEAQALLVDMTEAFVKAIDDDAGLGLAGVIEAKVVECDPLTVEDRARPLLGMVCSVEVLREVAI